MKVVCIDISYLITGSNPILTIGKIYEVMSITDEDMHQLAGIDVISDDGVERYYKLSRFKLLDEVREEKLNQLVII